MCGSTTYYLINNTFIEKRELCNITELLIFKSVYLPTDSWTTYIGSRKLDYPCHARGTTLAEMRLLRVIMGKTRIRNESIKQNLGVKLLMACSRQGI